MEKQLLQVLEFQKAFDVECSDKPKMIKKTRSRLRYKLLLEEVEELGEAKNILDVSDAICDILYVLLGSAHEYGIADRLEMLFDEVHGSNMSKMGIDGKPKFRKDGKVVKQKGYRKPKLRPILERDFTVYKNSDVMRELAEVERKLTEKKIIKSIMSNLKFFDRMKFKLNLFLERSLQKKVEVKFPQKIDGHITVNVYGKRYYVSNS
jgi:predicted HAD superfamily Cof-like phosphohydrolase